ncbi:MAG: DUF2062 domain-containing protein [Myxococcota bacterium]
MGRVIEWARALTVLNGSPHGIAGGFALGIALSLVPIPVLGMLAALALAPVLRLNPPATYLGTAVVNPLTGTAFYFGELWLGLWLVGQPTPSWDEARAMGAAQWWALFTDLLGPFALGAAVFITVGGSLSYGIVLVLSRRWQARRKGAASKTK